VPIDEEHPLLVLEARKPAYGMAKEFAEKLTLLAARTDGFPVTIFRPPAFPHPGSCPISNPFEF
jgi:nucleoside-diphosphate-sugar epimerase